MLILSTLFYHLMLFRKLPCRVPQDIPSASPAKNIAPESEFPKEDKPPSSSAEKTFSTMSKSQALKTLMPQPVPRVIQLPHPLLIQDVTPLTNPQGQIPSSVKKHPHRILNLLDSGHAGDHKLVEAHLFQGLRNNHDNIYVLQSPCGTTQTSSRLVNTSADT
jgi:hypothetical protein